MSRRNKRKKPQSRVSPRSLPVVKNEPVSAIKTQLSVDENLAEISSDSPSEIPKSETFEDHLIDTQQAMELLGISESTLRRMIKAHQLPGHRKIRGRHKFSYRAIQIYIQNS